MFLQIDGNEKLWVAAAEKAGRRPLKLHNMTLEDHTEGLSAVLEYKPTLDGSLVDDTASGSLCLARSRIVGRSEATRWVIKRA